MTAARQWALPEDGIVDDVAVDVAARGDRPVALTPTERRLVALRILAAGGSRERVARRLRVSDSRARALIADLGYIPDPTGRARCVPANTPEVMQEAS